MKQFQVDMKVGDVGLSGGDAFIQKAIRFFTASLWSHSFTIIPSPCGTQLATMETTSTLTTVVPLSRKLDEPDWLFVYRPKASEARIRASIERAWQENSGIMYGYVSYLWFMWCWLLSKLGIKRPTSVWSWARGGVTCTEFTAAYIKYLGEEYSSLIGEDDRSSWNPQRLCEVMDQNPDLFEKIGWANPPATEKRSA